LSNEGQLADITSPDENAFISELAANSGFFLVHCIL